MTNKELCDAIASHYSTIFGPTRTDVLDALDKLIDSEESAWKQLEELKDNDKSMQEPRDLNTTLKILDN